VRLHQPPDDQTVALTRLALQVDRLDHQLTGFAELRGDVEAHTRTLRDLNDLVRRLVQRTSATDGGASDDATAATTATAVAEWLTIVDTRDAIAVLNRLHRWVTDVWVHYSPLPQCWPWHPSVISELLICQQVWAASLSDDVPPEALAAWHDRWRPGVAARIGKTLAGCLRVDDVHVEGATRYHADAAYLDELAAWWAAGHGHTPPPGLTPVQHP
jgi:hypothetical protein